MAEDTKEQKPQSDEAVAEEAVTEDQSASEEGQEAKPKSKLKLIIISVVGLLVVVGGSVGATFFLLKDDTPQAETQVEGEAEAKEAEAKAEDNKNTKPQASYAYVPLGQSFVVTFLEPGLARHALVEVHLLLKDPGLRDKVKAHTPLLRNNLLMMFGGVEQEPLWTHEGRLKLKESALALIQELLNSKIGKPGVDEVLFTSFVMQ